MWAWAASGKNDHFRRMLIGILISAGLNLLALVLDASVSPDQYATSTVGKITGLFLKPGGTIAEWLTPSGHGAEYFIGGFLIAATSSVLIYAALAWVILSVPAWWRGKE